MTVPPAPPEPEIDENALYDLAADSPAEQPVKLAPLAAPVRAVSSGKGSGAAVGAGAVPPIGLGYQLGQTQREKERFSAKTLMDMKRDVYVPVALLIAGFALYVIASAISMKLTSGGIVLAMIGVAVMTLIKTALLVGFAFLVAGPLGVSFGGVWTAILKLAACAVFADAVTAWVDLGIAALTNTRGGISFGYSIFTFFVAVGVYWGLLAYLFDMDSEDSWSTVIALSIFDRLVKWAIIFLVLGMFMSGGGGGIGGGGGGGGAGAGTGGGPAVVDEDAEHIAELQMHKLLPDARDYLKKTGRQAILTGPVDAWYAAGAKNVWMELSKDINGRTEPVQVIVEMPTDPKKRTECIDIAKEYYKRAGMTFAADNLKDGGETYMMIGISG